MGEVTGLDVTSMYQHSTGSVTADVDRSDALGDLMRSLPRVNIPCARHIFLIQSLREATGIRITNHNNAAWTALCLSSGGRHLSCLCLW